MTRPTVFALGIAAVTAASIAAAAPQDDAIHACVDPSGEVVYQADPCDSPAMPSKAAMRPAPAMPATPMPAPATPAPGRSVASRSAAAKPVAAKAAAARPASKPIWVTTHAERPPSVPKAFTSDPRWGSPERTLHTFVAAMRGGDRALVKSCLTSAALTEFGPRVDALPAETLKATVDAFTGFVAEGDLGPFWSIRALRGTSRPKWIFFEKTGDGTWKISAI